MSRITLTTKRLQGSGRKISSEKREPNMTLHGYQLRLTVTLKTVVTITMTRKIYKDNDSEFDLMLHLCLY